MGPNREAPQEKFPKYLRREEEHLNPESVEKQFGQSNVYDSTAAILNRNRPNAQGRKAKIMLEIVKAHVGRAEGQ